MNKEALDEDVRNDQAGLSSLEVHVIRYIFSREGSYRQTYLTGHLYSAIILIRKKQTGSQKVTSLVQNVGKFTNNSKPLKAQLHLAEPPLIRGNIFRFLKNQNMNINVLSKPRFGFS